MSSSKYMAAHVLVARALRRGELVKQPCQVCGTTDRVDGHHEDYEKPLDIMWLCKPHHAERHKSLGSYCATQPHIKRRPGVEHAIKAAGGTIVALARLLDLRAGSISGWAQVPAKRVLQIERLVSGTSRHVMRPDLYPIEERSPHD